jgi:hypothetical protein
MNYVSPSLLEEFEAAITEFKTGKLGEFRLDPSEPHSEKLKDVPRETTRKTLERFDQTLDSAALVFGHSVLDAVAHDLCRVCALISPDSYLPYVESKKVPFSEMRDSSVNEVLDSLIGEYLNQLERESLLKKIDLLHALCKPGSGFEPVRNYKYSRERIGALDEDRHRRIHRRQVLSKWENAEVEMKYMQGHGHVSHRASQ